ncbi:hypothetical protein, partial [Streptomyces sp. NPDC005266]|uniref:hypothetical protein n=1 Tax=Streptomyces sp. NPDC005266 TaxID=3154877 RepID=UPI0033B26621
MPRALRRELLLQGVTQPRRPLGHLRGPELDRPGAPPMPRALRRELLLQGVTQPRRPLGHLRGPELDR